MWKKLIKALVKEVLRSLLKEGRSTGSLKCSGRLLQSVGAQTLKDRCLAVLSTGARNLGNTLDEDRKWLHISVYIYISAQQISYIPRCMRMKRKSQ